MHFILEGTILEISETTKWDSGFKKRELILRTDGDNTQDIKIDFTNDTCEKLDLFVDGESVMIAFTIIGNLYQGKYYTNLRGIAIGEKVIEGDKKKAKSRGKVEKDVIKTDDSLDF
jgi:hypothetical protein